MAGRSATKSGSRRCPDAGDCIWIDLDPTRGHEQRGRRPALVLSPRSYNERARLCIACPITNQPKGYPFEVAIHGAQGLSGVVLADQVRCLSWPDQDAQFIAAVPLQVLLDVREKLATVAGID